MKKIIFAFILFCGLNSQAQKSNEFLNRSFWKKNPSIKTIDQKISEGNDIAALNKHAFDAVSYALLEKVDTKTIQYLLSKKGNGVNKLTHDGRTYIFWAAYSGNLEMVKYIISKGAKTNVIDSHGYSVLNFAAASGQLNLDIYNYLFKNNLDITKDKDHNGANALLLISPHVKNYETIKYFMSKGASLYDKDSNGNGIFEYAAKGGNIPVLKALLKNGVKKGKNSMIFASRGLRRKKNTLEVYKFLESVGVNPNVIDKKGRNPLHSIARNYKDINVYKYFIAKGVNVNLQDKAGNSPFLNSTNNNSLEIVKFLSKYVEDINLKNKKGQSALTMAVNTNSIEVIKFLLEKGANVNVKDKNGNTLSYYLVNNYRKNKSTIFDTKLKILQKNGLTISENQNSKNTLLHIATQRNDLALLKKLSPFKIDVNAKNKENLSALQIAAMKAKDEKIIKYLLKIGADKNVKTDFEETLYDLASENELLKKQNINITFLK